MTNYTKSTNFTAKDSLPSGDSQKIIRGSEFDTEFNAIETAVNSKADKSGSVLNLNASSLLIGTTTDFTSTTLAGPAAFGGIGIYPYSVYFGAPSTNTGINSVLSIENQSIFSGTNGASLQYIAGLTSTPKISNTGAGGNSGVIAFGEYLAPSVESSGSTARVQLYGIVTDCFRGATNDLSTNTGNLITGAQFSSGHPDTLPVTARTGTIIGVNSLPSIFSGLNTELTAYRASVSLSNYTTAAASTSSNVSGFRIHAFEVGAASGPSATVTNGYGVYLRGPKVSATGTMTNYYAFYADTATITGTLTNRWGLYVADTANNYLNGNLLLGTTTAATNPSAGVAITGTSSNWNIGVNHPTAAVSGDPYATFVYNTTQIGSITQNGTTGVLYNTTSDLRLKENIAPSNDAGSLVDSIQIVQHDWKVGGHVRYGVIAQDLHAIAPEAVKQGDNNQEIENPWGVDYSKLVPMLIKEIQSLRTRVATLENN
jgi:hypothetical protein